LSTKVADQSSRKDMTDQPSLDEQTREFIRLALGAGLIELPELKKVVASLLSDGPKIDRDRLAKGLIGGGLLTEWQAKKLLAGRGRGFFLGSYKLLRPLGKGGMGVVYLGEHKVMKRQMALKILSSESAMDKRRIERFEAEARAAAQLDHPNIVRCYDFAEDNGRLFIAMEYIEGIDLQHAIERDGVMSIPAALDAMKQAANGLAHAHGRGIVHRDIKPANLMLRGDGVLKISDMGLARIGWQGEAPNESGNSRLLGTSEFLAPEQAMDSRSVDGRADIYSLGCTLYYLLTGKPPYPGATASQRIAKHQTAAAPNIRNERSDCPPALADVAIRMMAKRPEDRIPSATELLSQLNRVTLGAGSNSASQPLRRITPAGDTLSDGNLFQATLSDSALGGDAGPMVVVNETDLFDFGSLPPVLRNVTLPKVGQVLKQDPGVRQVSVALARAVAASQAAANTKPSTAKQPVDGNQQVMLGIGLALAFLALFFVVGIGAYIALRPQANERPIIKSTEDGTGKPIIIVSE